MKKILILILTFLATFSTANAVLNDSQAYYAFDSSLTEDATGNYNLTNSGNTLSVGGGILFNASNFSGTSHMTQSGGAGINGLSQGTINFWIKFDDETVDYNIFAKASAAMRSQYSQAADAINWQVNGEGQGFRAGYGLDWTQYHMVTYLWNSTNKQIYIDGSLSNTTTLGVSAPSGTFYFGHNSVNTNERFKGLMDEFGTWNRTLSASEISTLYNSGNGFNPFTPGTTPVITSDLQSYYNTLNISIQLNSTDNTNMSYTFRLNDTIDNPTKFITFDFPIKNDTTTMAQYCLENHGINGGESIVNNAASGTIVAYYNGSDWLSSASLPYTTEVLCVLPETTIGNNINSSTLNLTDLSESTYNITFISTDENGQQNTTGQFTIDVTDPTITDNLPAEINSYVLDFNSSTCNDTNIDTCTLNIQSTDYNLLTLSNATLTFNGNSSYTITATDLAGNSVNTTGVVFVNPTQYVYFEDQNSNAVTNFTIDGESFTDFFFFDLYDYGLGVQSFEFAKLGYQTSTFSLNLTNTSAINTTLSVVPAIINIQIKDRLTEALITQNVTLQLIATVGQETSTITGSANFSNLNFISEEYKIVASSQNYTTEELIFDYTNQEELNLTLYMLDNNQSNVGLITLDVRDENLIFLAGARCNLLEWKPSQSAFITVAQAQTNVNGKCNLNIEIETKVYQFQVTYQTFSKTTASERIFFDGETRTIIIDTSSVVSDTFFDLFDVTFTETVNSTTLTTRINLLGIQLDGLPAEFCVKRYRKASKNNFVLLNETCATSNSVDIEQTYSTNTTFDTLIVGDVTYEGKTYKIGEFAYKATTNIETLLDGYEILKFIPILVLMLGVVLSVTLQIEVGAVITIIGGWLLATAFPSIFSSLLATVITFIYVVILWGVYKKEN